jgi:hypothetical protein
VKLCPSSIAAHTLVLQQYFLQAATMDSVTQLLARTTLEDTTFGRRKLRTENVVEAVPKLRKTFDHFLIFRAVCSASSGHHSGSEHLMAGLNEVEEATLWQLRQWLTSHGDNVRHCQSFQFSAYRDRKVEIPLRSYPLPPTPYALSTKLHMMNNKAARTSK